MPGFASYDQVVSALSTGKGQRRDWYKSSLGTTAAALAYDLWQATGSPPAGTFGTAGTGRAVDSTSTGAMAFTNPTAPATLHGVSFGGGSSISLGSVMLYDRLVEYPFTGTATSLTTFTQPTIPSRDVNGAALGAGIQMMLESYTATARTATTLTVIYVNSAGTTGRSSAATLTAGNNLAGSLSNPAGSPFFWPMLQGDTGVRSITSAQLLATTGVANLCLTLIRPLAIIPVMAANGYIERDLVLQSSALPRIFDGSALSLAALTNSTSGSPVWGAVQAAEN